MLQIISTTEFDEWLKKLKDWQIKAKIASRIQKVAQQGHFGDTKNVGEGVSELRIHAGPGYRVYFSKRGNELIILLVGGDKSTQQQDIQKAQQLNKNR